MQSGTDHLCTAIFLSDYLPIQRQYRDDVIVLCQVRGPGEGNREYRYTAIRHFISWKYAHLGSRNWLVTPCCCAWSIDDKFPDSHGHCLLQSEIPSQQGPL